MLRGLLFGMALALAFPVAAQEKKEPKKPSAQPGSKALKGDERKKFMSECLKAS